MQTTSSSQPGVSLLTRLQLHLRSPLYRNGYALVLSSALTSGLGVLYWILAARRYTAEVVGVNSALISTMMFLASVSQLNLPNALNRFIPKAGNSARPLILYAYLISVLIALATSIIFLLGIHLWSPTLGFLRENPLVILGFIFANMAWCIFVLQDGALTGLRQAIWVPLENLVFALVKIVLLVLFAAALPQIGIFASWNAPVLVLLIPMNLLIFRRLIPHHVKVVGENVDPVIPKQVARYVAGDYFASLLWMATINLLPLLVVERAGAAANAYFYLSWSIAYSLYLINRNWGMSLIAEAAADETKLYAYSYRVGVQNLRLLLPTMIGIMTIAPYLLLLFGQDYASEGALLLRLLCLSALPNVVTSLYTSMLRVQQRMRALVVLLSSLCGLVILLSYWLLDRYGIVGIGIAWLAAQTIVAFVVLLTEMRLLLLSQVNTGLLLRLLSLPQRIRKQWRRRHERMEAAALLPEIRPLLSSVADLPPSSWQAQQLISTPNDVTVLVLGGEGQAPTALLKLARSELARKMLQRRRTIIQAVQDVMPQNEWHALLPQILLEGEINGRFYLVERMLPGVDARHLVMDQTCRLRVWKTAVAGISLLHQCTAVVRAVDGALQQRWVGEPLAVVRALLAADGNKAMSQEALARLADELDEALVGRLLPLSWIHGDFSPENILVTPEGCQLTGIVDWELATPDDLPQLDLIQLFLATRRRIGRCELGDVVRELLSDEHWTDDEQAIMDTAQAMLPGDAIGLRPLLLLAWLRHIAANLEKSVRYSQNRLWITKNVQGVLHYL